MQCKQATSESREITFLYLATVFCNTRLNNTLSPLPNNEDINNVKKAEAFLNKYYKYFQQGQ